MRKTSATLLLTLMMTGVLAAQQTKPLFFIERSKNSNKLYYEANLTAAGAIDARKPVRVYWILWAKDSTGVIRENLSLFESKEAYGFSVKIDPNAGSLVMKIVSCPARPLKIYLRDGKAIAETTIDGHAFALDKLFIKTREHTLVPKVDYVELFGKDLKTGQPRTEKMSGR
ncbi:MAG: DUF4833 domain-containing protein [Chitinivibrionales bacterium]|nr:DUF4833 domain-containing protein [Chitinivibrionales bacterium]